MLDPRPRAAPDPFEEQDERAGQREERRDEEEQEPRREGRSAGTPTLPRKLTKNASRTAIPLSVNGTSRTRKNSGPIT